MLKDNFSRRLNYLRVSVTDKCNLRCSYCVPPQGVRLLPHDEVLRNEEFINFIRIFVELGVSKIRFTGGEPLLRRGFPDIAGKTRQMFPDLDLCVTTNGVLLNEVLEDLFRFRVRKLNISLDSMNSRHYEEITGRDFYHRVINNIEKALGYNFFEIKINSVLFKKSIEELDLLLEYFKDRNVILRFIELMPFVSGGQHAFLSCDRFIDVLKRKGTLVRDESMDTRVALMYDFYYRNKYRLKIGLIPPVTHSFCDRCNRLRLTCDGFLKTCLHSDLEYDLKTPYRMDMRDEDMKKIILRAVQEKPEKHNLDCRSGNPDGCSSICRGRTMSGIGG